MGQEMNLKRRDKQWQEGDLNYLLARQPEKKCKLSNQFVEIENSEVVETSRD